MLTRFKQFLAVAVIAVMTMAGASQPLAAERKATTVQKKQKATPATTVKKKVATKKKVSVTKKKTVRKIVKPAATATSAASTWQETQKLAVRSSSALVLDPNGGTSLFQKNADVIAPIASITKLMTAMVVLDGVPNLQEPITISMGSWPGLVRSWSVWGSFRSDAVLSAITRCTRGET